jgi:dethiobiotin synthetase
MTSPAVRPPANGYFVTGTDTGVGKTLIACALLHAFARTGARVVGMKPVAAGAVLTADGYVNDDVTQLRAASTVKAELALLNPYCFEPAIAPHIAAAKCGVTIDLEKIVAACAQLATMADQVIVEGAGGFYIPLNANENTADLAQRLGLPVIIVVGMRLGCMNHALLTAQAIRACGLKLAGWVANRIDPAMPVATENITALAQRLASPLLGVIDFSVAPDARHAAAAIDLSRLG